MSDPSFFIAIYAGAERPSVMSTALSAAEQRRLTAWLSENPELQELVRRAMRLADPGEDDPYWGGVA